MKGCPAVKTIARCNVRLFVITAPRSSRQGESSSSACGIVLGRCRGRKAVAGRMGRAARPGESLKPGRPTATIAGFEQAALQSVAERTVAKTAHWRRLGSTIMTHFWFKCFGTLAVMATFFVGYFYVLNHPAYPVRVMPVTLVDRLIGFEPLALPVSFSALPYLSLPQMLMLTRREAIASGAWMRAMCLTGLAA